jgi:hypothetical protein
MTKKSEIEIKLRRKRLQALRTLKKHTYLHTHTHLTQQCMRVFYPSNNSSNYETPGPSRIMSWNFHHDIVVRSLTSTLRRLDVLMTADEGCGAGGSNLRKLLDLSLEL